MKNSAFIFLLLVLFSCGQRKNTNNETLPDSNSASAESGESTAAKVPDSVEDIKQLYANLNGKLQGAMLDSTSVKYDCSGERSGTITYFSENGKLRIIKHVYNEYSHFSAVDQYFISDNKLFFAHLNGLSWSFQSGKAATGATTDNITEKRLYISREKPLLCLEKKYVKKSDATDNPLPESVESKQVDCKDSEQVLKGFGKLVAFKNNTDQDCLGKE